MLRVFDETLVRFSSTNFLLRANHNISYFLLVYMRKILHYN